MLTFGTQLWRLLSPWAILLGLLTLSHQALALDIEVTADKSVVAPGEIAMHRFVVSNTDGVERTNVVVSFTTPAGLSIRDSASRPFTVSGCSVSCQAGETGNWALGNLPAGSSKTIWAAFVVANDAADGSSIELTGSLSHDGDALAGADSATSIVETTPLIDLKISAEQQLVAPGDSLRYEVAFGNVGASGLATTELRASLPSGTSLVFSSDGGSLVGNEVVWDTGVLNAGDSGKRFFTVQLDGSAAAGDIKLASASFDNGAAPLNTAQESSVVRAPTGLNLEATVLQDLADPGSFTDYRYVVTNTGSTSKTDVTLNVKADNHLVFLDGGSLPSASGCSVQCGDSTEDWAVYSLGELAPGESRVVTIQMAPIGALNGEVLATRAFLSEGSGEFTLGRVSTVLRDFENSLNLVVGASRQVVAASETFEYELSFGNVSGSASQNLMMELDLPEGSSFVSASDGGTHESGTVSWDLSTLNAGKGGKRMVRLQAPADATDGELLVSEARLHTGGPALVRSGESSVVRAPTGLNLEATVLQDPSDPSPLPTTTDYRYVVTNTGGTSKTDVTLTVKADTHLRFEDGGSLPSASGCSVRCGDGTEDWAVYSLGELAPGESRVVTIQMAPIGALNGEVLATRAFLSEGSGEFTLGRVSTVLTDDENSLILVVGASRQVVAASETFEYELSFGNVRGSAFQNLVMELDLPEGASFVSASDGGTHESGTVSWDLSTLNAGNNGKRIVRLQAPADATDGELLVGKARLHTGGPALVRSGESSVVRAPTGLNLEVTVLRDLADPGSFTDYRYVVTNTGGTSKTDVTLTVKADNHLRFMVGGSLPSASGCTVRCGNSREDWAVYSLGELAPGESRVVTIQMFREVFLDGDVLASRAFVSDGSGEFTLGRVSTVFSDLESSLNLVVGASRQVVAASETFEYELSFGNVSDSAFQNLVMELDLPERASFVSASDGGTHQSGTVSWDLSTLNARKGGKRIVRLQAPADATDGELLVGKARLHAGGPALVRSGESSVVRSDQGLTLEMSYPGSSGIPWFAPQYLVTNTEDISKTDVTLTVKADNSLRFQDGSSLPFASGCGSTCGDNTQDWAVYSLGELAPGESRAVTIQMLQHAPLHGEVLVTRAFVSDGANSSLLGRRSTVIFQGRQRKVAVDSSGFLVAPGAQQSFTLTVGGAAQAMENGLMEVQIPPGFSFVSATGTAEQVGDRVFWPVNIPRQSRGL